jgi:hypothetical protein
MFSVVPEQQSRLDLVRTRWMGAFFAFGAACFFVGPLTAYATHVGNNTDGLTFFVGSVLFTMGGLMQCWLASHERRSSAVGRATWRTAWVQSIGTLFFNLMTLEALGLAPSSPHYNLLVWEPNALGSVCFLISGAIFYLSSPRRGWLPERREVGWWEPSVNLVGCVLFGVSALTGLVISSARAMVSASTANWTTSLGAACFLGCALAALSLGQTLKAPRLRRLQAIARGLEHVGVAIESDFRKLGRAAESELQQVGLVMESDIERIELAVERHLEQGEI